MNRCLARWAATIDLLNQEVPSYRFVAKPLGFNEVYSAVENEEVDFVLANSSFYVGLEQEYGASPSNTD